MIRGAVYRIDLGTAKRGHEQCGRRFGLVLSPSSMSWTVATVVPTSTSAQPAVFRPELVINDVLTRFLVDQMRSIDTSFIFGDPVYCLDRYELIQVEDAVTRYLGL